MTLRLFGFFLSYCTQFPLYFFFKLKIKWKVRFRLKKIPHKQRTIGFEKARQNSVTFTDTVKNGFWIYHIETKSLIYFCQFTLNGRKLNSWHVNLSHRLLGGEKCFLITSKLANQRVERVLLICAVDTNDDYGQKSGKLFPTINFTLANWIPCFLGILKNSQLCKLILI